MKSSGYSGTPLAKKLGIKPGFTVRLVNQPNHYFDLFPDMPADVSFDTTESQSCNLIHYFANDISALQDDITGLRQQIFPAGSLWISWPKKASKIKTNLTEDLIRAIALNNGLVDVKVCAIDETWSGLKLVVPLGERV